MITPTEQKTLNALGKRIVEARKAKNMSQEALAASANLDRVAVGYIEQGRRRPTVTTMIRISNAIGIKLEELFKGL